MVMLDHMIIIIGLIHETYEIHQPLSTESCECSSVDAHMIMLSIRMHMYMYAYRHANNTVNEEGLNYCGFEKFFPMNLLLQA